MKAFPDIGLLVLRVGFAAAMLTHGFAKLMNFSEMSNNFADPIGLGMTFSLILVVFAEFFCSLFVIFGALTRLACIPLIITMAVAFFIAHADDPFTRKELPLIYLIGFLGIALTGAGKFSIDGIFCKGKK